jgi:hypothetical protein
MTGAHSCDAQENLTALPMWEGFGMAGRLNADECEWKIPPCLNPSTIRIAQWTTGIDWRGSD